MDIGNEYFSIDIMFPVQFTTFDFMHGVGLSNDNNSLNLGSIVIVLKNVGNSTLWDYATRYCIAIYLYSIHI